MSNQDKPTDAELLRRDAIWLPEKDAEIDRLEAELDAAKAENKKLHDALLPGEYNHLEINEMLRAELDAARKDLAFYKCCALSGEVPTEGAEPSAKLEGEAE